MTGGINLFSKPKLRNPVLVVGWEDDAGGLGSGVVDYLQTESHGEPFCEIDPVPFFSLSGVTIDNNVVVFPDSTFYAFPENDLVVFSSTIPRYEWFRFLNIILDVCQKHCKIKEIYTVGGMLSLSPHTEPRDLWANFSSPQMKKLMAPYELSRELNFETPPGGRPTLNSFLLWAAKRRSIKAANLWVPIPFYLVDSDDPRAQKKALEFFDKRLKLNLDFGWLGNKIKEQDNRIVNLREQKPDIDRSINKLEGNMRLSEEEHERLVKEVHEFLAKSEK